MERKTSVKTVSDLLKIIGMGVLVSMIVAFGFYDNVLTVRLAMVIS